MAACRWHRGMAAAWTEPVDACSQVNAPRLEFAVFALSNATFQIYVAIGAGTRAVSIRSAGGNANVIGMPPRTMLPKR